MNNTRIFSLLIQSLILLLTVSCSSGSSGGGSTPPVTSAVITLTPASLNFGVEGGSSNPAAQQVVVSSLQGTLAAPTPSISYGSGSGWLTVNCSGSAAPYTCTGQPNISGLAVGTYTATVNLASAGATNSPVSLPVSLTIGTSSQCIVTALANNSTTQCGPYPYSPDTEANGTNSYVGQDAFYSVDTQDGMWQTLIANNPGDWSVVANIPTDPNDSVKSFPNSEQQYNNEVLDNFHSMIGTFATSYTRTSPLSVDTGFDLWFNNSANEVMIQNDLVNRGGQCGPVKATVQFGGTNGVPVNTWVLCVFGAENIWQIQAPTSSTAIFGFQSGSVDIYAMIQWLENNGYIPKSSVIAGFSYGFELCSTGGQNWTLSVSNFSIVQN